MTIPLAPFPGFKIPRQLTRVRTEGGMDRTVVDEVSRYVGYRYPTLLKWRAEWGRQPWQRLRGVSQWGVSLKAKLSPTLKVN